MRRAAGLLAAILLATLLAAWLMRFRLATHVVDRKLAAAQVAASYRITRIGPFLERIEDLRIGDPTAPDLVARRIDVSLGYGLTGPTVRAIHAEGVRLRGRIDRGGLSLGAIDRLLPTRGGRTALPDLDLVLRDAALALATPNGTIAMAMDGAGNPQRLFRGNAQIAAPALRLGPCALTGMRAKLRVVAEAGRPSAGGPVQLTGGACPDFRFGAGKADVALSTDRTFENLAARAVLTGFGGEAGPIRFARIAGPVTAAGTFGNLALNGQIRIASLSAPAASANTARSGAAFAGTPFEPIAKRATQAAASLLAQADADADFVAAIHGYDVDLGLRRLTLTSRDDARVTMVAQGGVGWNAAGLRADADISTAGGGLPALAIELRQVRAGAPFAGTVRLAAPYRAADARLSADLLRFSQAGDRLRFDTTVTVDGPLNGGFVRGLELPLHGFVRRDGAFAIGEGCQSLAFEQVHYGGFVFAAARLPVCGRPLIARGPQGQVRIDAATGPVRLNGRTQDGAPVMLSAAASRFDGQRFAAQQIAVALGDPANSTHLAIATLDGRIDGTMLRGKFADGAGAIANVPLLLGDAAGDWTYSGGALQLTGALRVSDMAAPARFNPLIASGAKLRFASGVIAATAILREPASGTGIARIDLTHDLARGTGHAGIDVDGIRFVPKGLQPDTLTPLTLGVIANASGVVSGKGRIDWNGTGVTSTGAFGTDRLDLAAAFGPVAGISGQIVFTDLLGLVSAPHQEARIAEINPGIAVANGIVRYALPGQNRVAVESAEWPFAGGMLRLDPTTLNFAADVERRLTFRVDGIDAAAFVQQLDFPNISATGTFDGVLPMIFDQSGGRIAGGTIAARASGGTVAYIGELSDADLGTMGKLAFDALKAIRYSALNIGMDGSLDGEMVSRVRMTGVREATAGQRFVTRLIRGLPFRFSIDIRAPFRALVGSARTYSDPRALLTQRRPPAVQPAASETMP